MKAIPFPQSNKVLKAPPGQEGDVYDLPVWGGEVEGIPRCISCWEPSPEERAAIAAGGPVWLWVMGTTHPPLVLDAASPFEAPSQLRAQAAPRDINVICISAGKQHPYSFPEPELREDLHRAIAKYSAWATANGLAGEVLEISRFTAPSWDAWCRAMGVLKAPPGQELRDWLAAETRKAPSDTAPGEHSLNSYWADRRQRLEALNRAIAGGDIVVARSQGRRSDK